MFAALLPALIPLALKIIAYGFEKHYLSEEQKRSFLDFLQTMATKGNSSKRASDIFFRLHEKLKAKE